MKEEQAKVGMTLRSLAFIGEDRRERQKIDPQLLIKYREKFHDCL
jgi:hypothetical protein